MRSHRFSRPPLALRRSGAKLDNVALVPASLLPYKEHWQQVANDLPCGSVLVCLPTTQVWQRQIAERVVTQLRQKGNVVTLLPATIFSEEPRKPHPIAN